MELVEGKNLADVLDDGPLAGPALLRLARSLASGLAEIHRRGLVHRDLKPANVMVEPTGDAKVIDFGFAGGAGSGELVGNALYSAPEQSGVLKRPVDARSDLYALGALLHHAASGKPPFVAADVGELLRLHLAAPPPDLTGVTSPVLAAVIAKLLAKDPDDRYQTAAGLLGDLEVLPELERGGDIVLGTRDRALRPAGELPFVGGRAERGRLATAWAAARAGRGGALQIEGEPGSGKSRLCAELVGSVRDEGALVLTGKAQQGERSPLGPLREALDD